MRSKFGLVILLLLIIGGIFIYRLVGDPLNRQFVIWGSGSQVAREQLMTVQRERCADAPFILPADGFIGLLYGDPRGPYNRIRRHQGIDIFVDVEPGVQPVYAAYDGYITRQHDWVSTLIQRVPVDPLNPERTIWLYYTHMADEAGNDFIEPSFERGTFGFFVEQGTLLGYIGNYDGNVPSNIWTHLHFSVVQDDGSGKYLNEYYIDNTLDPTPYLGIDVSYENADGQRPECG